MSKRKSKEYEDKLKYGLLILGQISEDTTNPPNIKRAATEAVNALNSIKYTSTVRVSNAISILNEILQDPNMPPYSRVRVWNVISLLEEITD